MYDTLIVGGMDGVGSKRGLCVCVCVFMQCYCAMSLSLLENAEKKPFAKISVSDILQLMWITLFE